MMQSVSCVGKQVRRESNSAAGGKIGETEALVGRVAEFFCEEEGRKKVRKLRGGRRT